MSLFRSILAITLWLLASLPVQAQIVEFGNISGSLGKGEVVLDRFGNPAMGLRGQREPDLRRLREMQGRAVLEGRVQIYDMTPAETEAFLNNRNRRTASSAPAQKRPEIICTEIGDGEVVCKAAPKKNNSE